MLHTERSFEGKPTDKDEGVQLPATAFEVNDALFHKEEERIFFIQDSMKKAQALSDKMASISAASILNAVMLSEAGCDSPNHVVLTLQISILEIFETRLSNLESTMLPIYESTQDLTAAQKSMQTPYCLVLIDLLSSLQRLNFAALVFNVVDRH